MSGLLSGISAGWESIKSKVSGMGSWIKAHKGPETYDRKLLVDNGEWIMSGLMRGLDNSLPLLERQLGGIADTISGTDFSATARIATNAATASGTAATTATSSDNSTNYSIEINGTRINDDAQIRQQFEELMTAMARRGMM